MAASVRPAGNRIAGSAVIPGVVAPIRRRGGRKVNKGKGVRDDYSLWGGVERIGGAEGRAVTGRDAEGCGLEERRFEPLAKRGHQEGPNGSAVAVRDGDEVEVDSEAIGNGALANCRQRSARLPE